MIFRSSKSYDKKVRTKFAFLPVYCEDVEAYVWLEEYTQTKVYVSRYIGMSIEEYWEVTNTYNKEVSNGHK